MAGYSGTPLLQKLGIKPGHRILLMSAPAKFGQMLGALPPAAAFVAPNAKHVDVVVNFENSAAEYQKHLASLVNRIKSDGMIWIGWPKKASGVATDLTENVVRDYALTLGLVDIKVCAIDDTWSGLKLVVRKENRAARAQA
jgi:hypothetical protein